MSALNDPVWYISRDDQRRGPFSSDQFARFEEVGTLRPTDQVWQTGMDAWIDYNDYVARKSVAHLESPHRPSASGPEKDNEKCAICHLIRGGMRALTATLTTASQTVSRLLAKLSGVHASSLASDGSEHVPERTASPPADPPPGSVHPPLLGAQELDMRPPANGQILRHPAGRVIDHAKQAQNSAMAVSAEDLFQALPRSASSIPRLASEGQAAAQIGLDLATFRAWVAEGRLPRALPDCGKYDMKTIHLVLDRMSGIASSENG